MIFSPQNKRMIMLVFFAFTICTNAQLKTDETTKRIDDYLELLKLGYSEVEIFQDLGNVNFLTENYEAAAFWYDKLFETVGMASLPDSYKERYEHTMANITNKDTQKASKDWVGHIKEDYKVSKGQSATLVSNVNESFGDTMNKNDFNPTIAVTENGKVAFFSQAVAQKPTYGIFSKKEIVHEIYRAEQVDGKWKNFKKLAICPSHFSAKHPTVSADGTQLFFASNMPGSYGKYDIYRAEINKDGTLGIAKNLGPKVNTKKDDIYPSLAEEGLLLFASNGRKGYGGLDLFAVQVSNNKISKSINLGKQINSQHDDYSLALMPEQGMGYVMSNRGKRNVIGQFAVTYAKQEKDWKVEKDEDQLMKVLMDEKETDYSSTLFDN